MEALIISSSLSSQSEIQALPSFWTALLALFFWKKMTNMPKLAAATRDNNATSTVADATDTDSAIAAATFVACANPDDDANAQATTKEENDEESFTLEGQINQPPKQPTNPNPPSTWDKQFDPDFLSQEIILADLNKNIPANIAATAVATSIYIKQSPKSPVLIYATRELNTTVLLHNITGIPTTKGGESTNNIALFGMGRIATVSTINIMKMV